MFKKIGLVVVLLAVSSTAAMAKPEPFRFPVRDRNPPPKVVAAPELDVSSSMAGLTLLVGGLAVMLGRRSKRLEVAA